MHVLATIIPGHFQNERIHLCMKARKQSAMIKHISGAQKKVVTISLLTVDKFAST